MPKWIKSVTYLASIACSTIALSKPQYASFLVPLSTFLAGYATTHPSDAVKTAVSSEGPKGQT
jgi:hypothetical protein